MRQFITIVESEQEAVQGTFTAWHATKYRFDKFLPFCHFGTKKQAQHVSGSQLASRLIKVQFTGRFKRVQDECNQHWDLNELYSIKAQGFDGVIYLNRFEGISSSDIELAQREFQKIADSFGISLNLYRSGTTDELFKKLCPGAEDSFIVFDPSIVTVLEDNGEGFIDVDQDEDQMVAEAAIPASRYGYWITDKGEFIPVSYQAHYEEARKHGFDNETDASDHGWIKITCPTNGALYISLSGHNTKAAYNALRRLMRDIDKQGCKGFLVDWWSSSSHETLAEALRKITSIQNAVRNGNAERLANRQPPSPPEIRRLLKHAKAEGFRGFGGLCGEAAVAINRVFFHNHGKFIGAFNAAFLDHGHPIGHVAVAVNGDLWDADGRPKEEMEIESWGMLDPYDPDYKSLAEKYGINWNDETASKVDIYEFNNEQEVLETFGTQNLQGMIELLDKIQNTVNLNESRSFGAEGSFQVAPTRKEIVRYMSGDCAYFALALHDVLGYDLAAVRGHFLAKSQDGYFWDVRGKHSPETIQREFGPTSVCSRAELIEEMETGEYKCGFFNEGALRRAKTLLRKMLR